MNRDPKWLAIADRAYALALHLYPRAFRETWGAQMRQAMRDRWRERVRDGRSAFATGFILLPDLLAGAGREHSADFGGVHDMRKLALGAALVASLGLFAMQGRISTQVAAWQEARAASRWQELFAREDAYRQELLTLALASDKLAVRALALPLAEGVDEPGARKEALERAAGRLAADGSPVAEFLAAASCGDVAALARLQREEPENGAVWALTMTCALRSKDTQAARLALIRLGRSQSYDSRSGAELVAATELLKRAPSAAERAPGVYDNDLQFLENLLWDVHRPETGGVRTLCIPRDVAHDAGLAADCRAAAAVLSQADSRMIRQSGTVWLSKLDGRTTDLEVLHVWHRAWRDALAGWWALDDATREARVATGGSEIELLRN